MLISAQAAEEIKQQASKVGRLPTLRVGIRGGGCTGFAYVFEFSDGQPKEHDNVFEQDGAAVYIDPKSYVYLRGSELTFESTLMGRGFKIINPNSRGACGCGQSVTF